MDSKTLTFNCWVHGQGVDRIFPVEISNTKTVGALKEAIKDKKQDFRHIDADSLMLYNISLPSGEEEAEQEQEQWTPSGKLPLQGRMKLSTLSSDADEMERLIVVSAPGSYMILSCWERSGTTDGIFQVEISTTQTVAALKKAIKNELLAHLRDIHAASLVLYKVSLPHNSLKDALSTSTVSRLGTLLCGEQKLSTVFTPPPADDHLHLIVENYMYFCCWIRGAEPANSFEVRVSIRASVDGLKNAIKAAFGKNHYLPPDHITLYKIQISDETELCEGLSTLRWGKLLKGYESVREVFDDIAFLQRPCVVVELLNESRESHDGVDLYSPEVQRPGNLLHWNTVILGITIRLRSRTCHATESEVEVGVGLLAVLPAATHLPRDRHRTVCTVWEDDDDDE